MADISRHVVPLPATRDDLLAQKTMKSKPTLNDHVDALHVALWDNADYQAFLDATSDADAVEGSLAADNLKAAEMIRTRAAEISDKMVAGKKLATIVIALNVVLRRYNMTRKMRAVMIGGETYPANQEAAE